RLEPSPGIAVGLACVARQQPGKGFIHHAVRMAKRIAHLQRRDDDVAAGHVAIIVYANQTAELVDVVTGCIASGGIVGDVFPRAGKMGGPSGSVKVKGELAGLYLALAVWNRSPVNLIAHR